MLDVMIQAKNSIEAYNTALQIYSSNISNMNVIGYKRLNISFQAIFERILNKGTASRAFEGRGGTNPIQLGQSSGIASVDIDWSQGALTEASIHDLAVVGSGLFIVSPDEGETLIYTRSGQFHFDTNGNLVTSTGMQVYGFPLSGSTPSGGAEPINIYDVDPSVDLNLVSWTDDGKLALFDDADADGKPDVDGPTIQEYFQIALTAFPNPSGLEQVSGTGFKETEASGEPLIATVPGLGSQVGGVAPRMLEQSNVFYLGETIDSIEAQRAMSGSLTLIRLASDTISQFINRLS